MYRRNLADLYEVISTIWERRPPLAGAV